jgi:hypothetical protein
MKNKIKNPNIYFIGPTRTGSTTYWQRLKKNHDVDTSSLKETYILNSKSINKKDLFKTFLNNGKPKIDFNPSYFGENHAIQNLFNIDPNAQIVVVIRNPIQLLKSSYKYCIQHGKFQLSFLEYLNSDYIDEFDYETRLVQWLKYFKKDQIYFIDFDSLVKKDDFLCSSLMKLGVKIGELSFKEISKNTKVNSSGMRPRNYFMIKFLRGVRRLLFPKMSRQLVRYIKETKLFESLFYIEDKYGLKEITEEELSLIKKKFGGGYSYLNHNWPEHDFNSMKIE